MVVNGEINCGLSSITLGQKSMFLHLTCFCLPLLSPMCTNIIQDPFSVCLCRHLYFIMDKYQLKLDRNTAANPRGQCIDQIGYTVSSGEGLRDKECQNWQNMTIHIFAHMLHAKCSFLSIEILDVSRLCRYGICENGLHLNPVPR